MQLLDDDDVEGMLEDVGIPCRVGGVDTVGILRSGTEEQLEGQAVAVGGLVTTLTVRTSAVPDVAVKDAVSIADDDYRVYRRAVVADGKLTRLYLTRDDG